MAGVLRGLGGSWSGHVQGVPKLQGKSKCKFLSDIIVYLTFTGDFLRLYMRTFDNL